MLATTTVDLSVGTETEPGEGITYAAGATGLDAHFSTPSPQLIAAAGGGREIVDMVCIIHDRIALKADDRVTDTTTDEVWLVRWCVPRSGLGLDHTLVGVNRTVGVA